MTSQPYAGMPDLTETLSVVIGGSVGIGAAIAVGLAHAGSSVVLAARSAATLGTVAEQAASAGANRVDKETVDVRDPEDIGRFAREVAEKYGRPQVLINSAGGAIFKNAMDVTVEDWQTIHDTHLRGSFFTSQAFAPAMAEQGYGKIINLSSTWAYTVGQGQSVYSAAKAGISHLTSALALEWASFGIRVNALAPTATRTPRVENHLSIDPDREEYLTSRIPLGRLATPEDMVGPALFLASPMSDFVTGHTLMVDGGWVSAK